MVIPEEKPLQCNGVTKTKTKKSFREKLEYVKANITVEPVLACFVAPGVLARLATQNLNLDKACRVNFQYGDGVCDALIAKEGTKYQKEELAIQELVSGMEAWRNVLLTAIPSFLILFLGAWSDRTGKRKICILLPVFGDLLSCLSNIISVYFFYEIPVEAAMFLEAIFPALTGGWIATYMGAFSYISDVSSEESRTFRVGITNLCLTAGTPIGSALSGILLKKVGYYGVFSISALLYLVGILYGLFYIKDPEIALQEKPEKKSSVCKFLRTFFDIKHVKDTLTVAFKKGPNKRRVKSILILASIGFIYGPSYGEFTVRYLFTRYRFNWDALMYSFYSTFYITLHALGAIISISLFSRRLLWDDSVLALISSISKIFGGLVAGFARNGTEMYLAVLVETFNATSYTAMRSISSKLVTSAELGKMISLFNLMEVITSMVFGPVYSWIYMLTVEMDAGFVYYVSTVLTVPPIVIFWFVDFIYSIIFNIINVSVVFTFVFFWVYMLTVEMDAGFVYYVNTVLTLPPIVIFWFVDFIYSIIFNIINVSVVFAFVLFWIYLLTVEMDAGFVYYVSTVLTVPPIIIFCWFFKQHRNEEADKKRSTGNNLPSNTEENKKIVINIPLLSKIDLADEKIVPL